MRAVLQILCLFVYLYETPIFLPQVLVLLDESCSVEYLHLCKESGNSFRC